jgi:hypothetical protein
VRHTRQQRKGINVLIFLLIVVAAAAYVYGINHPS